MRSQQTARVALFVVTAHITLSSVAGHARLMEPPSRASLWRTNEFDIAPEKQDYNDNEAFCGGFARQHYVNEGECGICGDAWDSATPRDHEAGGRFAPGFVTRNYRKGQNISVEVDLSANHFGHFTFKLCANNDFTRDPQQECFDETLLRVLPEMEDDFEVSSGKTGTYRLSLELPKHVTCQQCILQWTYTCGNNWGFCDDGSGALGCGPQETFRACADVAIHEGDIDGDDGDGENDVQLNENDSEIILEDDFHNDEFSSHEHHDHSAHKPSFTENNDVNLSESPQHHPSAAHVHHYTNDVNINEVDVVPNVTAPTASEPLAKLVTKEEKDKMVSSKEGDRQEEKNLRKKIRPGIRRPIRPRRRVPRPATARPPPSTPSPPSSRLKCSPTAMYNRVDGMDVWCNNNCNHVPKFCPPTHCICS